MPLLLVEIKQTELGYCVNCYNKGKLKGSATFQDMDLAVFYGEQFLEEVGMPFPAMFNTVH
jgi:hypothetical protein